MLIHANIFYPEIKDKLIREDMFYEQKILLSGKSFTMENDPFLLFRCSSGTFFNKVDEKTEDQLKSLVGLTKILFSLKVSRIEQALFIHRREL